MEIRWVTPWIKPTNCPAVETRPTGFDGAAELQAVANNEILQIFENDAQPFDRSESFRLCPCCQADPMSISCLYIYIILFYMHIWICIYEYVYMNMYIIVCMYIYIYVCVYYNPVHMIILILYIYIYTDFLKILKFRTQRSTAVLSKNIKNDQLEMILDSSIWVHPLPRRTDINIITTVPLLFFQDVLKWNLSHRKCLRDCIFRQHALNIHET